MTPHTPANTPAAPWVAWRLAVPFYRDDGGIQGIKKSAANQGLQRIGGYRAPVGPGVQGSWSSACR